MTEVIGLTLGNAIGVAISPVPVIALILMLFSHAAVRNSLVFAAAWILGLLAIGLVVLALGLEGGAGEGSDSGGIVKILIGVAFLVLSWRQWRSRPAGAEPELPGWMSAIDDLPAARAFGLGIVLTLANPKNLGITVAAAMTIGAGGLSTSSEVASLAVFVVLASTTILVPVVWFLVARVRAEPVLDSAKTWLTANNATVMTTLFAVLGAKVLGDGLAVSA